MCRHVNAVCAHMVIIHWVLFPMLLDYYTWNHHAQTIDKMPTVLLECGALRLLRWSLCKLQSPENQLNFLVTGTKTAEQVTMSWRLLGW